MGNCQIRFELVHADEFEGSWTDEVWLADSQDLTQARIKWKLGEYTQNRKIGNNETYTVEQSIAELAPSVSGLYLVVQTNTGKLLNQQGQFRTEKVKDNNQLVIASQVINTPADLAVKEVKVDSHVYSGEKVNVSWTVENKGSDVWNKTQSWTDYVLISAYPNYMPEYSTVIGSITHSNVLGLKTGQTYTSNGQFNVPAGYDGKYYIYVISDAKVGYYGKVSYPAEADSWPNDNDSAKNNYLTTVFENNLNSNNINQTSLDIVYREPDLVIQDIQVSNPNPDAGDTITVTWKVTNNGTRDTRVTSWYDGVFLSLDETIDNTDYPLVDRGNDFEIGFRVKQTTIYNAEGKPDVLKIGQSYTQSATFTLPSAIGGKFNILIKADTNYIKDVQEPAPSSIRKSLDVIDKIGLDGQGAVLEFKDEGNNEKSLGLNINYVSPPDLQVKEVISPLSVISGQKFDVSYSVKNTGGKTPDDQKSWVDLIYISSDRVLDLNKDKLLGYVNHSTGLAANAEYSASIQVQIPTDMKGTYYVFVITDPAYYNHGASGTVFEFENDLNNATAALQPLFIIQPDPVDLQVTDIQMPGQVKTGETITVQYTVQNKSEFKAHGQWSDNVYLSRDNSWDNQDILLGRFTHNGGLTAQETYTGSIDAKLPAVKDGQWYIVVRPDIYNEVYEGDFIYTETGLNIAPNEANNVMASSSTISITVPKLLLNTNTDLTLSSGENLLYKVEVNQGETLRVRLDSSAAQGANELYIRYEAVPGTSQYDYAYTLANSPDQEVLIPTTQAGSYYILVKSSSSAKNTPVIIIAETLPLAISKVTPDQGGTGTSDYRWVTMDIYGAQFAAGALVKLSRPGVYEIEPERWQVLDATHIRAVFDLREVPHGLYDIAVINPNGDRVVEPYRYLVERAIEPDVTIGLGGVNSIKSGDSALYSVSLQSLTNVDTPYVRVDIGAVEMGYNEYLLEGLKLPFLIFGSNVAGQPSGIIYGDQANTQKYGATPTDQTQLKNIPWASLDSTLNTSGINLAPGYAYDFNAAGFTGFTFTLKTYPGLKEWIAMDFEGLREQLYMTHPDWKAQGLLDNGVGDLNKIAKGLAARFLDPEERLTDAEALALAFRFNITAAATPISRSEFIQDQIKHALKMRDAILGDSNASLNLKTLAADETQWIQGWLAALEEAGLLRPENQAPAIRENINVLSLTANLATGLLLSKAGENYKSQASIKAFFEQIQKWYGDTSKWAGDPEALKAKIAYYETRETEKGESIESPVPENIKVEDLLLNKEGNTHFIDFNVFVDDISYLEYLRKLGLVDGKFNPIGAQSLALQQYLQQITAVNDATIHVQGPSAMPHTDGKSYLPAETALPYKISFQNATESALNQIRLVTQIDEQLDPYSIRLTDIKVGDINLHVPENRSSFSSDFDFTGSLGFILRVSAGIDAESRVLTWLIQAIDPVTGEVSKRDIHSLLKMNANNKGFVGYTVQSVETAVSGEEIVTQARVYLNDTPPVDSQAYNYVLDNFRPVTTLSVTSQEGVDTSQVHYKVNWNAQDDLSGIRYVTLYVAENGSDFRIWKKQLVQAQGDALFVGTAGKTYEFLAVATDIAGNQETAKVSNAVIPDDGSRQQILTEIGSNDTLQQSAQIPLATQDRSYLNNTLFLEAQKGFAGQIDKNQSTDLNTVLSPFTLNAFASGFNTSQGEVGAMAMIELPDHRILVSAGQYRNQLFIYDEKGGTTQKPLFSFDQPIMDMSVDAKGQLWVLTGAELWLLDYSTGQIIERIKGPANEPLTHALVVEPGTDRIYVSSGNGIEIFDIHAPEGQRWTHFSNTLVSDLAFAPDVRLWAVRWTSANILSNIGKTDIVSFPLAGKTKGRAEVEYTLNGLIDSLVFGQNGTAFEGLLFASANNSQQLTNNSKTVAKIENASVWMIGLAQHQAIQLAKGGSRGESILITHDQRILVAQTNSIDELALLKAPTVVSSSIQDGAYLPLPISYATLGFDQAMWLGNNGDDSTDVASVLNPENYRFVGYGKNINQTLQPESVKWDKATNSVILTLPNMAAGQWRLEVSSNVQSAKHTRLEGVYTAAFTTVTDYSAFIKIEFDKTRADRLNGTVSYDVKLTNIGQDNIQGPLLLLLDPGHYFEGAVQSGQQGQGLQDELWLLDVGSYLQVHGSALKAGESLSGITVSVVKTQDLTISSNAARLLKFELSHQVYALPYDNQPPVIHYDQTKLVAQVNKAWTLDLEAVDVDGNQFQWSVVEAPQGVNIEYQQSGQISDQGYLSNAKLTWTPTTKDRVDSEILIKVVDSQGGVAFKRLKLDVVGVNHIPEISAVRDITLSEGQSLSQQLLAADRDGDRLSMLVRHLPAGAEFDVATGMLTWTPAFDQAGVYENIELIVSDGKHESRYAFNITVKQGYEKPVLLPVASQQLREGDRFSLQLSGQLPHGLSQYPGYDIELKYSAEWLPSGAVLNKEIGWLEWTPGFAQAGQYDIPLRLVATYTPVNGGVPVRTVATQVMSLIVNNANAAPQFESAANWTVLEGASVRLSVFAYDPDNPGFEPAFKTYSQSQAVQMTDILPSVKYQVSGLPEGAVFDPDTLEISWNPGYQQAGIYKIRVVATDDGNGTGTVLSTERIFTINVLNANRTPEIGDLQSVIVDKGAVIEIPVSATDKDGNPIELKIEGLPPFATYTQTQSGSNVKGIIRFAPQAGHRGDYTITVTAKDDGEGNINQVQAASKSFVVTVRSYSEAPVLKVAASNVAIAGQMIRIPVFVSDLDQDKLSYVIQGLPVGAQLIQSNQYGYAEIVWTPTVNQIGQFNLSVQVSDTGLPPENLGYSVPADFVATPGVAVSDIKIIVRAADAAPELLDVAIIAGGVKRAENDVMVIEAQEGQVLNWTMLVRDADQDQLSWYFSQLPRGVNMTTQSLGNGQSQMNFSWIPGMFTAQNSLAATDAGQYNFTVTATDGTLSFIQKLRIHVTNVNQQPVFTSVPLQLVYEGETLSFNLLAQDADSDALRYQLVHDENTPEGILVDATTGYVEWTPTANMVNNVSGDQKAYDLTFMVTDGQISVLKSVLIRVLDVNKAPSIQTTNRTLVVGRDFSVDIIKAAQNILSSQNNNGNIWVSDEDGNSQTQSLNVSFDQLPEGASYNAQSGKLSWIPGPGQVGKFVAFVKVSDGYDTVRQSITLNVVADKTAYTPDVHIETTPAIPVLPGQIVTATVRAASFSAIASTVIETRGSAMGTEQWQAASVDSTGRIKLTGKQPGLIEIRTTVIDIDGFTQQRTETIRVRDPLDNVAPVLSWQGQLNGASLQKEPVIIRDLTQITALVKEQQLMGYKLEIASNKAGNLQWRTLQETSLKAVYNNQAVDVLSLDPALLANGAYQLRLTAWDLSGSLEEIYANVEINSSNKQLNIATHVDTTLVLGSQKIDIVRNTTKENNEGDFANWSSHLFDTQLTHNQRLTTSIGTVAAWQTGAQVWLQIPQGLTGSAAQQLQYLNFSLNLQQTNLNGTNSGISQLNPVFSASQGWTLTAHSTDQRLTENLIQQGQSLYVESTGLAWVPSYFVLTSPQGTRYLLDQSGQVTAVEFSNGEKWLLGQNNIVLVGGNTSQSIEFKRDTQGRISQISGRNTSGEAVSLLYRYNSNNQLELVRNLITGEVVQRYVYSATGALSVEKSTAYLGATIDWMNASATQQQWQGQMDSTTQYFDFALRESELASTVKSMGATGAVIIAIETQGNVQNIAINDATVLSQQHAGDKLVTLVRVTNAGFKQLAVTAQGAVSIRLSVAGDINADGNVDALDSQWWQQAQGTAQLRDLNGDGAVNNTDLQILYANYGWKTNQAPTNVVADGQQILKTHTDLTVSGALSQIAVDREGDSVYWNIISSAHGVAQLSPNGKNLSFKPEASFSGYATVTLQADDGYAKGKPVELKIYVSDAKLVLIHIERLAALALGNSSTLEVTGDFADEDGVVLTSDYLQFVSDNPNILSVDAQGNVIAKQAGLATVHVTARGIEGVNTLSVSLYGEQPELDDNGFEVDVYPKAVTLPINGERQLKVTDVDGNKVSTAVSGTKYFISDSNIAEIGADGLIKAKAAGIALVTVVNNGHQYSFSLIIQQPEMGSAIVDAKKGAVVQDTEGNILMVAPGAVKEGTVVSIKSRSLDDLGMQLPAPDVLTSLAAFDISIGDGKTDLPLQLAIKVPKQAKNAKTGEMEDLLVGEEVFFWRKGIIVDENGVSHDTWWLLDNGVIGEDGVARTSSPPYSGASFGGEWLVTKTIVDKKTGEVQVKGVNIGAAIWASTSAIAMSASPLMALSALATFATTASPLFSMSYTIAGSYQLRVPNSSINLETRTLVYPTVPSTSDYKPQISALSFDPNTNLIELKGKDFLPFARDSSQFSVKVWLVPRGDQIGQSSEESLAADRGLIWQSITPDSVTETSISFKLDLKISLSQHYIYVERRAYEYPDGVKTVSDESIFSDLSTTWTEKANDETMVTIPNGVIFYKGRLPLDTKENKAEIQYSYVRNLTTDENGKPLEIFGHKNDPVAYNLDGTLAFIAGKTNNIYVLDTITRTIVYTIHLNGDPNARIKSMVINDGWLYTAQQASNGEGRLIRVLVDSSSSEYLKIQQEIIIPGSSSPLGYGDFALSADRYLAVSAPQSYQYLTHIGNQYKIGNVYVLDLTKISSDGILKENAVVNITAGNFPGSNKGKSVDNVISGLKPGEFIISSAGDWNNGITALTVALDKNGDMTGQITGKNVNLTPEKQDLKWYDRFSFQNIQRASDVVLTTFNGKLYAIVADYNFIFNEPTAWGTDNGFGFGHQIGGKLGIIEDPFGYNGEPKYLGATTPIPGGSIRNLSITSDGLLQAGVWIDEFFANGMDIWGENASFKSYHSLFVWNTSALIESAIYHYYNSGLKITHPFDRNAPIQGNKNGTQIKEATPYKFDTLIPGSDQYIGWIYGVDNYHSSSEIIDLRPSPLSVEIPPQLTPEQIVLADMNNYQRALVKLGANFSLIYNGMVGSIGQALGFEPSSYLEDIQLAQQTLKSVQFDETAWDKGDYLTYLGGALIPKMLDGIGSSFAEIPLEAIDVYSRALVAAKALNIEAFNQLGISLNNTGLVDADLTYNYSPPDLAILSMMGEEAVKDNPSYLAMAKILAGSVSILSPYKVGIPLTFEGMVEATIKGDAKALFDNSVGMLLLAADYKNNLTGQLKKGIQTKYNEYVYATQKHLEVSKSSSDIKLILAWKEKVAETRLAFMKEVEKGNALVKQQFMQLDKLKGNKEYNTPTKQLTEETPTNIKPVSKDASFLTTKEHLVNKDSWTYTEPMNLEHLVKDVVDTDVFQGWDNAEVVNLTDAEIKNLPEGIKVEDVVVLKVEDFTGLADGAEAVVKKIQIVMVDETYLSKTFGKNVDASFQLAEIPNSKDAVTSYTNMWVKDQSPITIYMMWV